jgi:hypothetical protein
MRTILKHQISTRQWAKLSAQMWQCDEGIKTGPELVQLLMSADSLAFPIETMERSPIGVVIRTGTKTWQRIE